MFFFFNLVSMLFQLMQNFVLRSWDIDFKLKMDNCVFYYISIYESSQQRQGCHRHKLYFSLLKMRGSSMVLVMHRTIWYIMHTITIHCVINSSMRSNAAYRMAWIHVWLSIAQWMVRAMHHKRSMLLAKVPIGLDKSR